MKMEKLIAKHFVPFVLFFCFATIRAAHTSHQPSQNPFEKKHFVLVHGAGHGAWCWYKIATLLTAAGHNVTTLDLFGRDTDFMDTQYRFDVGSDKPATAVFFGPKFMASSMYQLSPSEDLTLALTLARWAPMSNEELVLTKEKYGSVPRVFVMCDQDRSMKPDLQLLMINKNPPDEVKVINGSDHMVMFSRTLELFSNLHQIAHKYS
ncbi:hypothetical protein M0R45_015704 [Rubus argutus]|uniref:Uncharacterized protein n=1 Tax=Rubus argutus TaxID=59490 RepID=A0AAW1XQZ0_RUBAR